MGWGSGGKLLQQSTCSAHRQVTGSGCCSPVISSILSPHMIFNSNRGRELARNRYLLLTGDFIHHASWTPPKVLGVRGVTNLCPEIVSVFKDRQQGVKSQSPPCPPDFPSQVFYIPPTSGPLQVRRFPGFTRTRHAAKGRGDTLGSAGDCGKQRCVPYLKGTVK